MWVFVNVCGVRVCSVNVCVSLYLSTFSGKASTAPSVSVCERERQREKEKRAGLAECWGESGIHLRRWRQECISVPEPTAPCVALRRMF